jgi:hypothetical protein
MEGRGFAPARMASSDGYYLPDRARDDVIKAIINKKVN